MRVGLPIISPRLLSTTHIRHVFGRPIATGPPNSDPTQDEVEAVYPLYAAELTALFDAHAVAWLPAAVARRGLRIVRMGGGDPEFIRSKL